MYVLIIWFEYSCKVSTKKFDIIFSRLKYYTEYIFIFLGNKFSIPDYDFCLFNFVFNFILRSNIGKLIIYRWNYFHRW